tara:strand:- start:11107 stop:12300 length:1194 start_codon:yes stop_codon:yes gene_type:complete
MHTLKEILAEPQTMYDGGVVRMVDGGDTREEALKLRQKVEQIEVPEEPTSTGTSLTPYIQGAKKLVGRVFKQVARRIPGASLLDATTVADATLPGFEYPKKVFHSTTAGIWPEGSKDIPKINPVLADSDIGFHVMEEKDLPSYYKYKKNMGGKKAIDIGGIYTMPLKANIYKTIEIPDVAIFRNPYNWVRYMSTSKSGHLSNEELEKYSINIPSNIRENYNWPVAQIKGIQLVGKHPGKIYPKKSTIKMLSDDREEALKLWKDIIQGALKHHSEFESYIASPSKEKGEDFTLDESKIDYVNVEKLSEKWIKFLQNVLDKQGADAFSYKNFEEGTGGLSYMILDSPETIGKKIKGAFVEKPDPTKPELGKYKGGQVIPMYDGGMVQASAKPMYDGGLV